MIGRPVTRAVNSLHSVLLGVFVTLLVAGCQKAPAPPAGDSAASAERAPAPAATTRSDAPATVPAAEGSQVASPAPNAAEIAALDADFDPARDPVADLRLAMGEAQRSGRRVVLDVGGEWCIWCHRMDAFIERDATLSALRADSYVWMKVNYDEDHDNAAFLSKYPDIVGYPHLFVLDANGALLHSQNTGDLELGKSYDPGKFTAFLKQWAPKTS